MGLLWRGCTTGQWTAAIPGGIAAASGWALWHDGLRRITHTNHGTFQRHENPARYWLSMSLLGCLYLFALAALFLR
ncbi:MAG: hypothetical protein QM755_05365 [Luteolibacter sp.]